MADPTIQTFCCHHANGTDVAVTVMEEFDTDAYNAVCMFSSTLGILGAIYQMLPRQELANSFQLVSVSASRGRRIIVWLAVADLLASLGVFTRATLWINFKNIMPATDDSSSVLFCAISSAFIQYFYTATWIWTLCYAIDMRLVLSEKAALNLYYHLAAWCIPAILTTFGLSLLYLPDANCHTSKSLRTAILRILPNYIATYLPIAVVMIANPWLYKYSSKDLERIITCAAGQFTSKERETLDAVKVKFSVINFVFYVCWIPNLVNGILLWTLWFHLPAPWIIGIWYIMGFLNPLQALFNCLVYRRWKPGCEKIILPWKSKVESDPTSYAQPSYDSLHSSMREEVMPLLRAAQSINGYKRYSP